MDEYYAFFLENFSPVNERLEVPESSITKYQNKLPRQLLDYWAEHGWCGYANGLFWTVNPYEYERVLEHWLADIEGFQSGTYHVIARSAFGLLYVWGEQEGYCMTISSCLARYSIRKSMFAVDNLDLGVQAFFASLIIESNDFDGLFKPALKRLGALENDEIYGFVPALALGGPIELNNLQKVKVIEHLEFLSQLSPLQDWGFPEV
ncbi:glutamyl-tRNA amidotransferase [Pseudomonas floridensis]|uniref:Glutamyl-tRNA amidotransferase n=1 Tax=Pseudomonas floridensis TaxID=1958950 RepID=A0A1X0MZU9_9PSED|nr:GAD-like domain-containing protein [Pseudomonas floridensis]ORC56279.1 glutamyl-tRNA amidotransferase [Pseudomonas floridensis]